MDQGGRCDKLQEYAPVVTEESVNGQKKTAENHWSEENFKNPLLLDFHQMGKPLNRDIEKKNKRYKKELLREPDEGDKREVVVDQPVQRSMPTHREQQGQDYAAKEKGLGLSI